MDELQTPVEPDAPDSETLESDSSTDPDFGVAAKGPARDFRLKRFFGLLAASLFGSLAIMPYSMKLTRQMDLPEALLPFLMVATVVVEMMVSAVAIGLGLGLGPGIGMANLVVSDDSERVETGTGRWFWDYLGKPLAIGIALGALMGFYAWAANFSGDGKHGALSMPSPWEGLLASIGAGVREEIWLRLGLMTFLVWLGFRFVPRHESHSERTVVWIANLLAALGFAAMHIPQAHALLGLSAPLLVFIVVGNGVPGLVFGWLYWRRGLVAAMLAHFGLDLVLKVLIPLSS